MILLKIFGKYSKSMVILEILKNLKISENFEFFFENFGKRLKILEKIENFGKKLKILEKNFQSRRQILTARGVYHPEKDALPISQECSHVSISSGTEYQAVPASFEYYGQRQYYLKTIKGQK